jgi:hypothetical protein
MAVILKLWPPSVLNHILVGMFQTEGSVIGHVDKSLKVFTDGRNLRTVST